MAHVLPTLAAFALSSPPLPPSLSPCKFEKASPRLATHLARKNIYTHVCSQPYKSPGMVTWQWEHRKALFLPAQSTDSPGAPPFLTVTPTGAGFGQRQPFYFGPISWAVEMVADSGLALLSIPPLSVRSSLWGVPPATNSPQDAPLYHHRPQPARPEGQASITCIIIIFHGGQRSSLGCQRIMGIGEGAAFQVIPHPPGPKARLPPSNATS